MGEAAVDDFRTPGQLLEHLLRVRGWTQRVLAVVLGIEEDIVSKLIAGKRNLDAVMALALGEVFDVPPERFMDLQKSYELARAKIVARPDPGRSTRAQLFGQLPVGDMIRRGWLDADDVRDVAQVERALMKFFRASSVDEIEIMPHAAKKTEVATPATPVQLAWLYRVREIADEMLVKNFSLSGLRAAVEELRTLRIAVEATRKVPRILQECGVRLVFVEALAGSKIDGVAFWLNDFAPVIGMSLRFDRIDNFWFVLRHEIEHLLCRHGKGAVMLDADLGDDRDHAGVVNDEERVANDAAAEFCVPQQPLQRFVDRKAPFFYDHDIVAFAKITQVHPGIVAGQLRRRLNRYDRFKQHLAKVRSYVAPGAMVDGWGNVAPVGM